MLPWHSHEVSSNPCSSAHCASFVLSFLGLAGLQALQLLPDGRKTSLKQGRAVVVSGRQCLLG